MESYNQLRNTLYERLATCMSEISALKSLAGMGISSLLLLAIHMYSVMHFAIYGENETQSSLSNAIVYLKRVVVVFFNVSSLPLFDNRKHTFSI